MEFKVMAPTQSQSPITCDEKDRLRRAQACASADFSRAVQVLEGCMMDRSEYDHLLKFSEEARLRSDQARLALERHVAEHGC